MATLVALSSSYTALTHPVYNTMQPVWQKFVHVYDGTGGFLDGTYLVAHPREWKDFTADTPKLPTAKLKARRKLARYENVAGTLLDQKRSALFRSPVVRTLNGKAKGDKEQAHPLEDWWDNVDGEYCTIDDWMGEAFIAAALFGHMFHYMDRPASAPGQQPKTAADQQAPYLRMYTPLDVPDWRQSDRGRLTAVRFREAVDQGDITKALIDTRAAERVVTDEYWELYGVTKTGATSIVKGDHEFGVLPVVVQYATRKALAPLIGQSVLGDPQLFIDLYNLTSEIRELLRAQTFGILNVQLGTTADRVSVIDAQAMLGDEKGSENVMFTPGPAQYVQPDTNNITVYQEERKDLLRTIYRLASVPWESDSKDAEAEGSMKLKREDMNQVLAAYAKQCEKAEYQIAMLWFRAMYGKDEWQRKYDEAEVLIRYPQTFDVTPFADILEQAQAAVSLEMGPKFMAEQRKRLVPKFLPDLAPSVKAAIETEIDATPVKSPAQQKLEEMALRFGGGNQGQPGVQPGPGGVGA